MAKTNAMCELPGCRSKGREKESVGRFMVYDGGVPTMTRAAAMCDNCLRFAQKCGMDPASDPEETKDG